MSFSVLGTRFGHTEGRVGLAYSTDGEKVVTIGCDGELRTWKGLDDDDCENFLVGDEGLALAVSEKRMYVGASQSNVVAAYSWEGDSEGVTSRFTGDVTCLAMSGHLLAAGSADMTLKVLDTQEFQETLLEGHQGPILSVALAGGMVASSSCDGTVRLWRVATKAVIQTLPDVVAKSNDVTNSSSVVGLAFSPCGSHLAIPTPTGLTLLTRGEGDSWAPRKVALPPAPGAPTALAWSPEGELLLVATNKGGLILLAAPDMTVLKVGETGRKASVCSVAWHPSKAEVVVADMSGHWGLLEDVRREKVARPAEEDQEDMEALFNDDEEEDENSFSIGKVLASTGYKKDEDGNLTFGAGGEEERPETGMSGEEGEGRSRVVREVVREKVHLQPPFQPGASPPGLSSRFLVYNSVGVVRSHSTEEDSSLDVEFHDVAVHHSLHLPNNEGVTMAALSSSLLALASPSKLTVNYFSSSDATKEWSVELGEDEEVVGVAVGEGWVALATSLLHLRLLTAGGMQRSVTSMPGPLVTMVGCSSSLLVVTHSSHPLPGQQALLSSLHTVSPALALALPRAPAALPLTPGAELHWAGFTDLGLAATCDTAGLVRVEDRRAHTWLPVLDLTKHSRGQADFHYMVSVSQVEGEVRCVVCRGTRHPPTLPRPLPTTLPLLPPLLPGGERGELEQQAASLALTTSLVAQAPSTEEREECLASARNQEVKVIMQLFALACRSDHESRAVEVARLLPDLESLQMAIKYAAKARRVALADRLGRVAMDLQEREEQQRREEQGQEEEKEEEEESQDMFAPTQENPFLAKREAVAPLKAALPSQSKSDSRNPFAKKNPATSSPSTQGFVFDSVQKDSPAGAGAGGEKRGFGERSGAVGVAGSKLLPKRKPLAATENLKPGHLKGVALYMAEGGLGQEEGLAAWKALTKEEKEAYKVPRLPRREEEPVKRKRSEEEEEEEAKKAKTTVKAKLAGFAAS